MSVVIVLDANPVVGILQHAAVVDINAINILDKSNLNNSTQNHEKKKIFHRMCSSGSRSNWHRSRDACKRYKE